MGNVDELIEQYKLEAEQLTLSPSPAVWDNIDREINPRNRRRILFIILFLLAGLVALGFFTRGAGQRFTHNTSAANTNNTPTASSTPKNKLLQQPIRPTTEASEKNTTPNTKKTTHKNTIRPQQSIPPIAAAGNTQPSYSNVAAHRTQQNTPALHGEASGTLTQGSTTTRILNPPRSISRLEAGQLIQHATKPAMYTPTATTPLVLRNPVSLPHIAAIATTQQHTTQPAMHKPAPTTPIILHSAVSLPRIPATATTQQHTTQPAMHTPAPTIPIVLHSGVSLPRISPAALARSAIQTMLPGHPVATTVPALPQRTHVQPISPSRPTAQAVPAVEAHRPSATNPISPRIDIEISPVEPLTLQNKEIAAAQHATFSQVATRHSTREHEELLQKKIDEDPAEYEREDLSYLQAGAAGSMPTGDPLLAVATTAVHAYLPIFEKEQQPTEEQVSKKDSSKTIKNRLGIAAAIGYVRNNAIISEKGPYQFIKNYRDSTDRSVNTLNYSLALRYALSDRVVVHAGIGINKVGENISNRQIVYDVDSMYASTPGFSGASVNKVAVITPAFYDINNDSTGRFTNTLTYIALNVGATCNFLSIGKLGLGLQPSLSVSKLARSHYYYFDSSTFAKAGKETLSSWAITAGMGLVGEYRISHSFSLSIMPHYNLFLSRLYKKPGITDTRYGQTSMSVSLTWWLK